MLFKKKPKLSLQLAIYLTEQINDICAIYPKPRTSTPHPEHKVYSYLLRDVAVTRPNQVWCTDITYIPMKRGFFYLVAKHL